MKKERLYSIEELAKIEHDRWLEWRKQAVADLKAATDAMEAYCKGWYGKKTKAKA